MSTWGKAQGELFSPAMIASSIASKVLWRIVLDVGLLESGINQSNPLNLDRSLQIMHQISTLSNELRESQASMTEILGHRMYDVVENFSYRNRFADRLNSISRIMSRIDRLELRMNKVLQEDSPVEQLTLTQFAQATIDLSNPSSVIEQLHKLETEVTGSSFGLVMAEGQDIFTQLNMVRWHKMISFNSPNKRISSGGFLGVQDALGSIADYTTTSRKLGSTYFLIPISRLKPPPFFTSIMFPILNIFLSTLIVILPEMLSLQMHR